VLALTERELRIAEGRLTVLCSKEEPLTKEPG